jgi:outer membrane immunogenic protein
MKKLLLGTMAILATVGAGSALAADLPLKAPPMVVPIAFSWTGFYVGGNAGYSWGRAATDLTETEIVTATIATLGGTPLASATATTVLTGADRARLNGALGGLQAGYNWQTDRWVWGIEGDLQITGERGGVTICPTAPGAAPPACPGVGTVFGTANYSLPWFGTLRGRAGVAWDRALLYVTGGLAVGEVKADYTDGFFGAGAGFPLAVGGRNLTRFGWVAGAGIEGAVANNWSVKLEYLHVDLGSFDNAVASSASSALVLGDFRTTLAITLNSAYHTRVTDDILRIGLNYRFSAVAPAVVTKY